MINIIKRNYPPARLLWIDLLLFKFILAEYPYIKAIRILRKTILMLVPILLFSIESNGQQSVSPNDQKSDSEIIFLLLSEADSVKQHNRLKAINLTIRAVEISDKKKLTPESAKANFILGKLYHDQSNFSKAIDHYQQALQYYKMLDDKNGIAKSVNNIATCLKQQGNYHKALEKYLEAYEIYRETENTDGFAAVCNNLGDLYFTVNQTEKALELFNQSQKLFSEIGDSLNAKNSIANKGAIYFEQGKKDSALICFRSCMKYEISLGDSSGLSKTLISIGDVYHYLNKVDSAIGYLERAVEISKKQLSKENLAIAYNNLGALYKYSEKYKIALAYYDSCITIASEYNFINQLENSYFNKAEIFEKLGKYRQALNFYQQFEQIKTSLLFEQNLITETEAIFLKQNQENKILKLERIKDKRRLQTILLLASISFLVILMLSWYRVNQFRNKEKIANAIAREQEKQFKAVLEAQENERKRIAGDLHDSVGQLLSVTKYNISELADVIKTKSSDEQELITNSMGMLDKACIEVRNISHNLMPGSLIRLGLVSAIKELLHGFNNSEKLIIEFNSPENYNRLSEKVELAIYRIVQEILNNAIKHAKAHLIKIDLQIIQSNLNLIIKDDGIGFNPDIIKVSNGIGWKNINSRLSMVNGTLKVKSGENKGTEISVIIPLI